MQVTSPQHSTTAATAAHTQPPRIFTVAQFGQRNPAFSPASLRNLIFKADERQCSKGVIPGNGLIEAGAIVRIGRKVLIDEAKFFEWVEALQGAQQ